MIQKIAYATLIALSFSQVFGAAQMMSSSLQTRLQNLYHAHPVATVGVAITVPIVLLAAAAGYYTKEQIKQHLPFADLLIERLDPIIVHYNDTTIEVTQDGFLDLPYSVDAIVNAANGTLVGGGGVDGAIHEAACNNHGRLGNLAVAALKKAAQADPSIIQNQELVPGCAVITDALDLKNRKINPIEHIIHVNGPRDGNPEVLANCYTNALQLAHHHNVSSIAFCCIGTGIFEFPSEKAPEIALQATKQFIDKNPGSPIKRIIFALYENKGTKIRELYRTFLHSIFSTPF